MNIPIVNTDDEIIAKKERSEIDYNYDIFRTASLWITNSKGDVLLAQRKFNKKVEPGKWGEAVGGTVEGDDSYFTTIIREAEEELGLKNIEIIEAPKQFITKPCQYFIQWYKSCVDLPLSDFVVQTDEVEQIAWMPIQQLKDDISKNPDKYITDFIDVITFFDQ